MPPGSRGRPWATLLLTPILLVAACGSPTASSPSAEPSRASAGQQASDPLCERFAGIYATWASAWKRDVDLRLNAGVELDRAQERASRSLTAPFRRAVLAEVDRDAENAQDPILIGALSALTAAPDDQAAFERLSYVCGTVGPIPEAR